MPNLRPSILKLACVILAFLIITYLLSSTIPDWKRVASTLPLETVVDKENQEIVQNLKEVKSGIEDKTPLILLYTTVFREAPRPPTDCKVKCDFSTNKDDIRIADAVVFHGGDFMVSDVPRERGQPFQKWVFWSMEAPGAKFLTEKDGIPALKPDWMMTYSYASDIKHVYGGFFVPPDEAKKRNFHPIANFTTEQILKDKQFHGAIGFISNCVNKERLRVAKALSRYIRVDIGGKCAYDKSKVDLCPHGKDCTPIINWSYFYLAFENVICDDYVTEKMTNTLSLPIIPIVMSKRVYKNRFPPEAFIAVDDFKNVKELAKHLTYLMKHPKEYVKLFEWRKQWGRAAWESSGYENGLCGLCKKLQTDGLSKTEPIQNITEWREERGECSTTVLPSSFYR
ncbi:unnamed protein product [Bursaphelenchus okinawaensis]|uniref:Fucosyltransferase n=1 Tax=Bursaphelenchus okinawaensis TaxID=465554 RepID=A0A811K0S0_9BILA|nr:unnamed protein product [Bursaphelenchus okinawaensis]CAG9088821.1 unnamed protein product [Bursaphelenchus okinawaensis]